MRFASLTAVLAVLALGDLPAEKDVKIVKLFEVPHYCEGIVFDHDGNGYISHGEVITKFTPDGKHAVWTTTTTKDTTIKKGVKGAPNGHKVLADGTHLVCDGGHNAVLHLDAKGN